MNDDFNTPILIATLFDGVKAVNGAAAGRVALTAEDIASLQGTFQAFLRDVLGLASEVSQTQSEGGGDEADALLDLLVNMRTDAKTTGLGTADKIRDVLATHGITSRTAKTEAAGAAGKLNFVTPWWVGLACWPSPHATPIPGRAPPAPQTAWRKHLGA